MPTFKPKNTRKIVVNSKNTITLDRKHSELLEQFTKNKKEIIPSLKKERLLLKNKLKNNISIDEKLEINDNLCDLW